MACTLDESTNIRGALEFSGATRIIDMFITILATVACVSVVLLPAIAEWRRMQDDRDNPTRLLKIPTRRWQVETGRK